MGNQKPPLSVTIICPVYNEAEAVPIFYQRLKAVLDQLDDSRYQFKILFTNNGSTDNTYNVILDLRCRDPRVGVLTFSRNFGYQASLTAGLQHVDSDATLIIDVDCEDPPELLPRFLEEFDQGYDLVYGLRRRRKESAILQGFRKAFYRITRLIADNDFILDMAEFSLFSRRMREQVLKNKSTFPFIRAELGYIGFKRKGIPYDRQERVSGTTHYNYFRMTQFAIGGILSSSTFFLRLATYIGFPLSLINILWFILCLFTDIDRFTHFLFLLDFSYCIVMAAFFSAYLARIYKDNIQRPLYIVDEKQTHFPGSHEEPGQQSE